MDSDGINARTAALADELDLSGFILPPEASVPSPRMGYDRWLSWCDEIIATGRAADPEGWDRRMEERTRAKAEAWERAEPFRL